MRAASALLLSGLALPAQAASPPVTAERLGFGPMLGESAELTRDPTLRDNTLAGIGTVRRPRFGPDSTIIEGRFCAGFGVRYQLHNLPPAGQVVLQVHATHPVLTRPDGASSADESYDMRVGGDPTWVGFTFAESWSLVPGPWTFELSYQGRSLLKQSFEVRRAADPGALGPDGCSPVTS